MFIRAITASIAAVLALGLAAGAAEADHRKKQRKPRHHDSYYAGPDFVRGIPGIRLFLGDYAMTRDEYDALYGDDDEEGFDESYYEPEPVAPAKPQKKQAQKKTTAPVKPVAKPLTTASVSKPSTTGSTAKAEAPASGGLSCDKAASIVTGYGFEAVKPETCKGKTYAFAATRDGKSFAIKLDSASGELTEVKKLQ